MRTPDAAFRRRLLTEALTVVAAPAPAQTAWLERHGVVTDEIALDLDGRRVGSGAGDRTAGARAGRWARLRAAGYPRHQVRSSALRTACAGGASPSPRTA
ncbi:hypothetical protein E2C11_30360 [Streptomyces lavendulae]|nr:hypothetical protein E2C11_30360 [Streptomyces lavendulae]